RPLEELSKVLFGEQVPQVAKLGQRDAGLPNPLRNLRQPNEEPSHLDTPMGRRLGQPVYLPEVDEGARVPQGSVEPPAIELSEREEGGVSQPLLSLKLRAERAGDGLVVGGG